MRRILIGFLGLFLLTMGAWATTYTIDANASGSVAAIAGTPTITETDIVAYIGGASGTDDSRGWMKFDVSSITLAPGENVISVEVSYYVFSENWPYYDINSMESDPVSGTAASIFSDCADGSTYLSWTGSPLGLGYRTQDLGAQANTDVETAIGGAGWFALGFNDTDGSTSWYDSCYGAAGSRCTQDVPYLTIETGIPPNPNCGGPDCGGYYFANSLGTDCPSYPTFIWRNVTTNTLTVGSSYSVQDGILGDDDWEGPFPLGFTINYYGVVYDSFCICSNGYVTLGTQGYTSLSQYEIPSPSGPNGMLAWFWRDMNPSDTSIPDVAVYWGNHPISGNMIITLVNYPRYGASTYDDCITAQIEICPNRVITFSYLTIGAYWCTNTYYTVGIEDADGICGTQYSQGGVGGPIQEQLSIMFGPSEYGLPVELTSFEGAAMSSAANLQWVTESESGNSHFVLYRSTELEGEYQRIAMVEAQGEEATGSDYSYVDRNLINGVTYYYRLADVDLNGHETIQEETVTVTPIQGALGVIVDAYKLHQNYPNPFNPNTTITYDVKESGHVTLKVYNVMGQEVATLVDEVKDNNRYQVMFDASGLAAGVYFYRVNVNDYNDVAKMVILK